ncbi:uncharacterized protein B0H64DRAFT_359067 [Chaetomium fimeti]|uniref:Uncharacterized protein n=1 Tax=Chaetomium fimeti TaxID=1854472 RepID=A0AAE0LSQ5_9PEZI|nr:hypothetical protein B0H64DRAFT_359067 [Chaetomium fimeti]
MATAKRTATVTLRNSRRRQTLPIALFAIPTLLTSAAGVASATCEAEFLFPTSGLTLHHLDTINITYRSDLAHPSLSCWCGATGRATQKFRDDDVGPFNGSATVTLTFLSDDPCWFELGSHSGDCRRTSETFLLSADQRNADGYSANNAPETPRVQPFSTTPPLTARTAADVDSKQPDARGDSFSTGARAALGVGVALICIAIGAMASFLYFRRRRRTPDTEVSGNMFDQGRRGRKGPEKKRGGALSETSGSSDEPLCPIQPVYDGFPGSMGYEDVRSLHSTSQTLSTHSHSPTTTQSPTHSQSGGFWTHERSIEREELTAARLKSQLQPSAPTVVSYGPNPVTPTLTPRITPRLNINPVTTPVTPGGIEQVPGHVPMMPLPSAEYSDYSNYSIPPPAPLPMPTPDSKTSPPRQQGAIPIVVSYGPNRVTPTPLVVSPTVPPDESIVNRRIQEASSSSAGSHERQFSWEADSPLLGASMGPLPPYATTADFEAMEKGAVRKLAEPQAQAELPPTKDGFYHYTSDIVEYELPGAAPQHAPQLPFRPYQPHSAYNGAAGGSGSSGPHHGQGREIDEQKFLLDDVEIMRLRAAKAKARAKATSAKRESKEGEREAEEHDLGEGPR